MDDDEKRIRTVVLTESWADLRAYSSNMWQITAFTFAVVSFIAGVLISQVNANESFILTEFNWLLTLLIVILTGFATYLISWISKSISQRIEIIRENEEQFTQIKPFDFSVIVGNKKISSKLTPESFRLTRALSWIPVQPILLFFYIFLFFDVIMSAILSVISFSRNAVSLLVSLSFLVITVSVIVRSLKSL
ncbi:MAG: hypothetical protein ACFFER_17580 [Candidatus Thorarchaeota archaeon]